MEHLIKYLNSIYPMSDELQVHLKKILRHKELKQKKILLKAGHICENVYFIEKGLVRCYEVRNNVDVCKWFMREGDVVFEVRSFLRQIPSLLSIQALEDTYLYYISHKELQKIYRNYCEFNFVGRELTEKYYLLSEERADYMRLYKSDDRYKNLLASDPDLVSRVSKKDIATYIGLSGASMDRVRGHLSRRH